MKHIALIPAAGVGSRFGANCPKQYVELAGQTVLQHTIDLFNQNSRIHHIAIIVSPQDAFVDTLIRLPERAAVYRVGGETRAETVANGVNILLANQIVGEKDTILVHDAARCCLPQSALNRLLDTAGHHPHGGILAIPVADTLKRQQNQQTQEVKIAETVPRSGLWQAQTPQLFQAALLQKSLQNIDFNEITDEASAVERLGIQPLLVEGDSRNIKLTRADDADYVAWLLERGNA